MRRKLWPQAPTKEGALGQMSKNFRFTLHIHILLRNQTKKITIERKSYSILWCYYICFMILYWRLAQKKMETEKRPKKERLSPICKIYFKYIFAHISTSIYFHMGCEQRIAECPSSGFMSETSRWNVPIQYIHQKKTAQSYPNISLHSFHMTRKINWHENCGWFGISTNLF